MIMLQIVSAIIQVLVILVIARALGSFFIRDWSSGPARILWDLTEPVLAPVRRLIPPMGGLDFSPLIVIIALQLIQGVLIRY